MKRNFLLLSESYKACYSDIYPDDITYMYGSVSARRAPQTLFGLQYIINEYLVGSVFTKEDVYEAEHIFRTHFGSDNYFNPRPWLKLHDKHNGRLPIIIKAPPEGTNVVRQSPLLVVENTDPEFPWIVPYLENILTKVWYPSQMMVTFTNVKNVMNELFEQRSDTVPIYAVHDSGHQSIRNEEDRILSGMIHLLFFGTSDNLSAISALRTHYYANLTDTGLPGLDHSVSLTYSQDTAPFNKMFNRVKEGPLVLVSDTYDNSGTINNVISTTFADKIKERSGVTIIRLDSGNTKETLIWTIKTLGARFGFETNSKGMRVLNNKVRVMTANEVFLYKVPDLFHELTYDNLAPENLIVGWGFDANYPNNGNNTVFNICNITKRTGENVGVARNGLYKEAFMGRIAIDALGGLVMEDSPANVLETVFEDGKLVRTHTFEELVRR